MDINISRMSIATESLTSPVSWPTMFWALFSIALNTCLQRSGNMLGLEPSLNFLIKSSPCYCLVDSVVMCAQLVYYGVKHYPQSPIRLLASVRNQHRSDVIKNPPTFGQIIVNALLLFGLTAQSISIFTIRGAFWTQLCAATFLVNYLINGVLNTFGKPLGDPNELGVLDSSKEEVRPAHGLMGFFRRSAAISQVVVWTAVISAAIPSKHISAWPGPLYALASCVSALPILIWMLPVPALFAALTIDAITLAAPGMFIFGTSSFLLNTYAPGLVRGVMDIFDCSDVTLGKTFGVTLAAISMTQMYPRTEVSLTALWTKWVDNIEKAYGPPKIGDNIRWGMAACYIFAAFALFHLICRGVFMGRLAQKYNMDRFGITSLTAVSVLFMFCCNMVVAVIYYARVYDPETTFGPVWSEYLGRGLFLA